MMMVDSMINNLFGYGLVTVEVKHYIEEVREHFIKNFHVCVFVAVLLVLNYSVYEDNYEVFNEVVNSIVNCSGIQKIVVYPIVEVIILS